MMGARNSWVFSRIAVAGGILLYLAIGGSCWAEEPASEGLEQSPAEDSVATVSGSSSEIESLQRFGVHYYGIYYGSAFKEGLAGQSGSDQGLDPDHSVHVKNFIGASVALNDVWTITPTLYWIYRPVAEQKFNFQDPFLRVSNNRVFGGEEFNLYADARVHFPLSSQSRTSDLKTGVQSFQALTYLPVNNRFSAALYASVRYNFFGSRGVGNDLEVYFAPNFAFEFARKVSLTLLCEMGASHVFGQKAFQLVSDGIDLEPGVSWDVTPQLTLNPYLNIYPSSSLGLRSSSIGMTLSWSLI